MKNISLIFTSTIMLITTIVNGQQVGRVLTARGERYNPKDGKQGFHYELGIDDSNNLKGSIIQENTNQTKEWCGYLKVTVLEKDKKILDVFTTPPHKIEPTKDATNNSITYSQNVKWRLKDRFKVYSFDIEAVESCTLPSHKNK